MNATATHREMLRKVMNAAWGLFRAEPGRGFADALAGAWRWVKRAAERVAEAAAWTRRTSGKHVRMASMIRSPIRRAMAGQPYAGVAFARANYLTSRIGA